VRIPKTYILLFFVVAAFQLDHAQYSHKADIVQSDSHLIVRANDPRPLEQALVALMQKYGWPVNYEDPLYSPEESKDIAAPEWRKLHPGELGVLVPSGGTFTATLGDASTISAHEKESLQGLIVQYNDSNNPGAFRLVESLQDRFAIIGRSRYGFANGSSDRLDLVVPSDSKTEVASVALENLISKCATTSGTRMVMGTVPLNILNQSIIPGHKGKSSCRDQLDGILRSLDRPLVYLVLYDIGSRTYVWNIVPVQTPFVAH
jgi:hypothetical protein